MFDRKSPNIHVVKPLFWSILAVSVVACSVSLGSIAFSAPAVPPAPHSTTPALDSRAVNDPPDIESLKERMNSLAIQIRTHVAARDAKAARAAAEQLEPIIKRLDGTSAWEAALMFEVVSEVDAVSKLSQDEQKTYYDCVYEFAEVNRMFAGGEQFRAIAIASKVREHVTRLVGENSRMFDCALLYQANGERLVGDYKSAAEHFQTLVKRRATAHGSTNPSYAEAMYLLAETKIRLGDMKEAEALLREALAIERRWFGVSVRQYADGLMALSEVLVKNGRGIEADATLYLAWDILEKAGVDGDRASRFYECKARVHLSLSELDDAKRFIEKSVATAEADPAKLESTMLRKLDVYRAVCVRREDTKTARDIEAQTADLRAMIASKRERAAGKEKTSK